MILFTFPKIHRRGRSWVSGHGAAGAKHKSPQSRASCRNKAKEYRN
jgi:hypothetical protein